MTDSFGELGGHKIARAVLFEAEFGMCMKIAPNGGAFIVMGADGTNSGQLTLLLGLEGTLPTFADAVGMQKIIRWSVENMDTSSAGIRVSIS